ncbi:MAG: ABC transporter permease [Nanoarchaeota archaeon]
MINIETILYSLRNLKQKKGRSALTIFSILIGITTIFIFISFGYGLYNYTEELASGSSADKIIIQPASAMGSIGGGVSTEEAFKLTEDDVDVVNKVEGVYEATGLYLKSIEVKFSKETIYTLLLGYDPKKPMVMEIGDIGLFSGRMITSSDSSHVLLGYNYQIPDKIFSKAVGLNDNIEVNGKKMKVVGFLEAIGNPQDDAQVYISSDYIDILYSDENNSYGWIIGRVETENINSIVEDVKKKLRKHRGLEEGKEDFYVQSFNDLLESFSSVLNIIIGFIILIALISVLVSAINTANTMITSVLERYKEIGVLKAIGAKNSEIFGIFLFESSFLGLVAGTLGVLLGWILTNLTGKILENLGWGFLSPYYSKELFIGCILFAVITGAISGVIPAIRASKINTVEALRYE